MPYQISRPFYTVWAAIFGGLVYLATGLKIWAVVAATGAMINLFNLIPIWQLDGARGRHSFTRNQRIVVLALALALWMATRNGMLFLIVAGAAYRLFQKDAAKQACKIGLIQFVGLLLALTTLQNLMPARYPKPAIICYFESCEAVRYRSRSR